MAIVGVLLAALGALTSSLLGFSARSSAVSTNLTDLSDVVGYLALRARDAREVWDGVVLETPSGDVSCVMADGCLALLVPVTARTASVASDGAVTDHALIAFRVMPVDAWISAVDPSPDSILAPLASGWRGATTPILVEYTSSEPCAGPGAGTTPACSEAPSQPVAPSNVSVGPPSLVVHGIVDVPVGGDVFSINADVLTLRLQAREVMRGTIYDAPREGPLVAAVFLAR